MVGAQVIAADLACIRMGCGHARYRPSLSCAGLCADHIQDGLLGRADVIGRCDELVEDDGKLIGIELRVFAHAMFSRSGWTVTAALEAMWS